MNINKLDFLLFYIFLAISTLLLGYVVLFAEVHYEGSESIYHYFHSRAIFDHPEIALNHWGKPLFIALSSPFALLGEKGVMLFNSIVMLMSAVFAFRLGKKLNIKFAFPLVILVIYAPVYFRFSQSCLTEPLFGLVAIASAYFFLVDKYKLSAIVISFLLFSRSEGMLFIPIYAFALILRKQYKAIFLLFAGFIVYGIIGLLIGKGFFWYYYDYPYRSTVDFYGTGPFWNYFINQEHITGTPFSIYLVIAMLILIVRVLRSPWSMLKGNNLVFHLLIVFPACVYVFGHSYLWYKGISASVGLYRIVGGVIPLLAVIAMYGLDVIVSVINKIKYGKSLSIALLAGCSVVMLLHTFKEFKYSLLLKPEPKEELILESINWLKESRLDDKTLYVYQAHYLAEFDGDHFDRMSSNVKAGVDNPSHPHEGISSGDLIIWDGQISPNEGRLFVEQLDTSSYFIALTEFRPEVEYTVLGGGYYYIKIFQRK